MIEVVTIRYGTKYGPEYLQAWAAGVKRNITVPYRMVCFTDEPTVYDPDVHLVITEDLGTWWNQLWIFCGWTDHRQLYIDLDDVIVGSLDDLASYTGPYASHSDAYCPRNMDSGLQLVAPGFGWTLWWEFIKHRDALRGHYRSPKEYLIDRINQEARTDTVFPGQWLSYKVDLRDKGLQAIPANARIIGMHGEPKPTQLWPENPVRKVWDMREGTQDAVRS